MHLGGMYLEASDDRHANIIIGIDGVMPFISAVLIGVGMGSNV